MSIQSIRIRNFQSHDDTRVDLHPGVNAFIGASRKGKSALLRSIMWVLTNKPGGMAFRSHWAGKTSTRVDLILTGGPVISRVRGKSKNMYVLQDKKGKRILKAMGADVPPIISKILAIGPLNWQRQLDAHFLLSASAGEASRIINKVAHLEDIDLSAKNINALSRANEKERSTLEAEVTLLRERLKDYKNLDALAAEVKRHAAAHKAMMIMRSRHEVLMSILSALKRLDAERLKDAAFDDMSHDVEAANVLNEKITVMWERHKRLATVLAELCVVTRRRNDARQSLSFATSAFKRLTPARCPLCGSVRDTTRRLAPADGQTGVRGSSRGVQVVPDVLMDQKTGTTEWWKE